MHIYTHPVGQMQANCYFVVHDNHCVVVDPGDSADTLLEEISRSNYIVDGIIATHGHFDHVMAVGEMQLALDVPFYMSLEDEFLITRLESTARHFLGYEPHVLKPSSITDIKNTVIPADAGIQEQVLDSRLRGNDKFFGTMCQIGSIEFVLIPTPGHTPGSVCLYFEQDETILTGDTLFAGGIGRYDFSYSEKKNFLDPSTCCLSCRSRHLFSAVTEIQLPLGRSGQM